MSVSIKSKISVVQCDMLVYHLCISIEGNDFTATKCDYDEDYIGETASLIFCISCQ